MTKTKRKSTKSALLSSVLALCLCFAMLIGSTFAWFTDSVASGSNVIKSGTLDIDVQYTLDGSTWDNLDGADDLFQKGLWEPGHTEVVLLKIENKGNLALKYTANMNIIDETTGKTKDGEDIILSDILTVSTLTIEAAGVDPVWGWDIAAMTLEKAFEGEKNIGWGDPVAFNDGNVLESDQSLYAGSTQYVFIKVDMPETVGNEANHDGVNVPTIEFGINVLATQYTAENDSFNNYYDKNAEYPSFVDKWDGTVDTSWYDPSNPQTAYDISTAEQLAGLAELVSNDTTFAGVTFTLTIDVDLFCEDTTPSADGDPLTFRPIGDHSKDGTFEGVFDGNGKTISNLYQNGWDLGYQWGTYGSYGLFGNVNDATIKNLTISGAESYIEGGDVGGITGSATGTCVFENITIADSDFATYNNGNGGIIGWSGAGNYTFKNITIAEDVTLAGLWGSFDSSIGGIVGQGEPGATYNFENVDIACRLDVYNDCTASNDYYNYRMCGMIIGRLAQTTTIDGVNYPDMSQYNITCENVTVTYGDWANYHYCEPTPGLNGGRGMRVEAGYAYDGLPADYDHSQCVDNHMNLIPFDQIFGGAQYGVKGLKTYDGVDVIYNNK